MKKERAKILIPILLILVIILAIVSRQKYLDTKTENYQQQKLSDLSFLYEDEVQGKQIEDYIFPQKFRVGQFNLYNHKS